MNSLNSRFLFGLKLILTINLSMLACLGAQNVNKDSFLKPGSGAIQVDGLTDLFWHNVANYGNGAWQLQEIQTDPYNLNIESATSDIPVAGYPWRMVATADFDRDGQADILWRDEINGNNAVWFMQGIHSSALASPQYLDPATTDFEVAGTGDFNNDGYPDILWQHKTQNAQIIWFMGGSLGVTRIGATVLSDPPAEAGWKAVAAGDFNNDTKCDILWRKVSGSNAGHLCIWYMNGVIKSDTVLLNLSTDMAFKVVSTGLFGRHGKTDILWRNHSSGVNLVFMMNGEKGSSHERTVAIPAVADNWTIGGVKGHTNSPMLSAKIQTSPPTIMLSWLGGPAKVSIEKKGPTNANFSLTQSNYVKRTYTDTEVELGKRYEYKVGQAYISVGVDAVVRPEDKNRGTLVLVVENTVASNLTNDITKLKDLLAGDGWKIIQKNVAASSTPQSVRNLIISEYQNAPASVNTVFLLGQIPVPYSGMQVPDSHGARALPADVYYADMDGVYTDSTINQSGTTYGGYDPVRHDNFPGDGKWDQVVVPGNGLELAIGRVDFRKMTALAGTEMSQISSYITKDAAYRKNQLTLPNRVVVGWRLRSTEERDDLANRLSATAFGASPDKTFLADAYVPANSGVWGIHGANGGYDNASTSFGFLYTSQLSNPSYQPKVHFISHTSSYTVDWDSYNNLLRGLLSCPYVMNVTWNSDFSMDGNEGMVPLKVEKMGLGETIGSEFKRTINASIGKLRSNGENVKNMYLPFLGDPTLRMHTIFAPDSLSYSGGTLSWVASESSGVQYVVEFTTGDRYSSNWSELGTAFGTTFPHNYSGTRTYRVRARKLITTGSGTYYTLSQGALLTVN